MRTILVATDGSTMGTGAVAWAASAAVAHDASLIVMTGFVPSDSELPPERVARLVEEEERRLEAWAQPAEAMGADVTTVLRRGDPRSVISSTAAEHDADLVVVGRVGTSAGPGLLRFGSVVEHLAHAVDRPLAVIGEAPGAAEERILVGVDGSDHARSALQWAGAHAARIGATVLAAFVDPSEPPVDIDEQRRRAVGLEPWIDDLRSTGARVELRVTPGTDPAQGLLEIAEGEEIGLVVVGMRGLGGFTGLRIGRTALRTLHRIERPLVLVPPAGA